MATGLGTVKKPLHGLTLTGLLSRGFNEQDLNQRRIPTHYEVVAVSPGWSHPPLEFLGG